MIYPLSTPQLEYLILSVLCKRDSYGYEISQQLKTVTNTKDSTLYPILKRLQGNGLVVTYGSAVSGAQPEILPDYAGGPGCLSVS